MLRTHWITDAGAAKAYFKSSDYYASVPGEWLGLGAEKLGLKGHATAEEFGRLCDNINPITGEKLRPLARDGERVGMDFTFNSTKSVGIARELGGVDNAGDPRIEEAHREAVSYAMGFIEKDIQTRVRGGRDGDRVTGNMVAYRVTHRDTRISAEDQKPDMSLHDHVFCLNVTFDPVEQKWKAAQMGQIKHDAPYYEAIYHNRLASNLRGLGYGIKKDAKAFEISGISRELVEKFSRRRTYIKKVAEETAKEYGIPEGARMAGLMDVMGKKTRLGKTKELADDLNGYYVSRLTDSEKTELQNLAGKPSYVSSDEKAVQYAIGHEFYRQSVVEEKKLYETALRHGIGSVTPEGIQNEARRQGVLLKDGEATTSEVLAEEGRIISFAREGRGTMRPLGSTVEPGGSRLGNTATLSAEQQAMVSHVLQSRDQVVEVIGDAGTGKTHAIKAAFEEIKCPVEILAPSSDASRNVLRKEGFSKADTVASFLFSIERQNRVRNGVIWIDEAGMLPIADLSQVVEIAKRQNARIVLQGDPKQHKSPARHGNMMNVLQEYAGLPVGRLTEIWRQKTKGYKAVVESIAKGDFLDGYDKLDKLGWIVETPVFDHNKPLVDDYMDALQRGKSVLAVAPTHKEGDEITEEIRKRLKEEGRLGDEKVFEVLTPLNWTEAEKCDDSRYDGSEVVQYFRNSGAYRAGQRVNSEGLRFGYGGARPKHFAVYHRDELRIAVGDRMRITATGKDITGKHRLNNGAEYTVAGFTKPGRNTPGGDIVLSNGWVIGKDFSHLTHAYVSTSHAAQGKTTDVVLIAMGGESRGAISAEQFYVSVSRGRESAKVYSDLSPATLRDAIQKSDTRKSATELMKPKPKKKRNRIQEFMRKARDRYQRLRERAAQGINDKQRELKHER